MRNRLLCSNRLNCRKLANTVEVKMIIAIDKSVQMNNTFIFAASNFSKNSKMREIDENSLKSTPIKQLT